jgi:carboxypeptidase T
VNIVYSVRSDSPQAPPLRSLVDHPREHLGLDIWQVKSDHVVLRASEEQAARLRQMGYTTEEVVETENHLATFATADAIAAYHSAETLESDLHQLAESQPEIAELHEIGRSLENRPIWALRIGERRGSEHKLLFMGCHHAREWISVEVAYLLAEHLVTGANQAPVRDWLQRGEIWVAPMVNPDGHEYSRTQNRLWRKNRRQNPDGSIGVDPNRNYGYMWGTLDVNTSSHVPRDETYVGPRAFSEPETQAVRNLVARELFHGVITYHSFSQLILYPWGYTNKPAPDAFAGLKMAEVAKRMAQLIQGVHGTVYTPEQSSQLYPTAGDTTDWTYGEYGIPSFTIELRPDSVAHGGFVLPPNQIQPTFEENLPAAEEFIKRFL